MARLFQIQDDDKSPEFSKYLQIIRKFPVDSNAAAQEKGLSAVSAFVEYSSPSISSRIASELISGIITKCLISPKFRTKELAQEIVLMYIEVERQETVIEELLKGTENKSPKIVVNCISLLKESLRLFGPRVIKPAPLIKIVPKLLEDRDKNVRDETKVLAVEIYRWMKDVYKSQIQGLKPIQISELEAEFEKIAGEKAAPVRYLRSEQNRIREPVITGAGDEGDGAGVSQPQVQEDIDPYELLEPVEILSKLSSDFYTNCESKKWAERKAALESLQELLTPNPKLAPGDYGDLIKVLKKFIQKDTMIPVVAAAAKCLGDLAFRLRKAFQPYAHSTAAIMIEKFKEKKQNVVLALREALDAVMLSISLDVILEDVTEALKNKNPQIKSETASFLTRQFSILPFSVLGDKKLLKPLVESLIITLNDMDAGVREAAADSIGTVMKVVGEKMMNIYLADVEPIKIAKIKEFHEKASVKYAAPPGGHPPPHASSSGPRVVRPPTAPKSIKNGGFEDGPPPPAVARPKKVTPPKPAAAPKAPAKSRTDCGLRQGRKTSSVPTLNREKSSSGNNLKRASLTGGSTAAPQKEVPEVSKKQEVPPPAKFKSGLRKPAFKSSGESLDEPLPPTKSIPAAPTQNQQSVRSPPRHQQAPYAERDISEREDSSSDGETYVVKRDKPRPSLDNNATLTRMVALSPKVDVALNMTMAQLMSQEPEAAIAALNQLRQIFNRPAQAEAALSSKVDQIILMCNLQYRLCTQKLGDDAVPKSQLITLLKSVTCILDCLFKHPTLKLLASRDVLQDLMPHVISIILEPRLTEGKIEDGSCIVRSVNILATSIIVNADHTNMMSALIRLLTDCVSSSRGPKFTEMVMKCIWKMIRFVEQYIDTLSIDKIFLDVHIFMKQYPSEFWKRDASRQDTPLRTVKTIVFILIQQKGEEVFDHLTLIPDTSESELLAYMRRAIKQAKVKKDEENRSNSHVEPTHANVSSTESKLNKQDTRSLSEIFAKLGSLEPREGFIELHHFIQSHPDFNIESHLMQTSSEFFRNYVLEGLSKVHKEQETSTPPVRRPSTQNGDYSFKNNSMCHMLNGNGSTPTSGVTRNENDFKLQSQITPQQNITANRSKLGRLSGNTGIPGPSSYGSSSRSSRVPRLPPPESITSQDVLEWVKAAESIGSYPAKTDDPSVIQNLKKISEGKYQYTGQPDEDIRTAHLMAEDSKRKFNAFKEKWNHL